MYIMYIALLYYIFTGSSKIRFLPWMWWPEVSPDNHTLVESGVVTRDPYWGNQTMQKYMVILSDLPRIKHCLGGFHIMTPVRCQDVS